MFGDGWDLLQQQPLHLLALEYEKAFAAAVKKGAPVGNQNASRSVSELSRLAETIVADLPQSQPEPGRERKSRERAAKLVGVSGRAVQQAKAILRDTPDLADKVRRGAGLTRATHREHGVGAAPPR